MRTVVAMTLCVATLVVALSTAWAQPANNPQRSPSTDKDAKDYFRRGTQLYDLGKYDDAAREYEKSFALSDRAVLLFNIGQAYRLAGRVKEAIAAYRGFVRRLPDSPTRAEAESHIAELEQLKPPDADPTASSGTKLSISHAVSPPKAPLPRWKQGWVWGIVGGAVLVGVAVGVGVGVGVGSGNTLRSYGTVVF